MRKKIFAVLLTGVMLLSLAGCDYNGNASKTDGLMKKAGSVDVYDASGKTKVDVTMGSTKTSMDFPLGVVAAGGTIKNYSVLSIPDDVSSYDYKDGDTKILLKSKEGYQVNIEAFDYTDANTVPSAVVDKAKEDLATLAKNNNTQPQVLRDEYGTYVAVLTYDRRTDAYLYFFNGTALIKYTVSFKSDGSQNLVTKAKGFIETIGGVDM